MRTLAIIAVVFVGVIVFMGALACVAVVAFEGLQPDKAKQAVTVNNAGIDAYQAGNLDSAMASFSQAIQLDPTLDNAWGNRGQAELDKGSLDAALADCEKSISLNPNSSSHFSLRGRVREAKGDLDGALADYTKATQINPNDAESFNNRGLVQTKRGNTDAALADFDHAISLKPTLEVAVANRAAAKEAKNDLDGAMADYSQALKLDPKDYLAYNNRGMVEYKKADYDAAIADFDQAIASNPKSISSFYNRANAKANKDDLAGSLGDYAAAIAIDPKAKYYESRGWIKFRQGDFAGSIDDCNEALKLEPDRASSVLDRAYARYAAGDLVNAESNFKKALDLKVNDNDYPRFFLCLIGMKNSDTKAAAIQDLTTYLAARPTNAPTWPLQIGRFITGQMPEADFLSEINVDDPKVKTNRQCEANFYVGMVHELNGDTAGALPFYQQSAATNLDTYSEFMISRAKLKAGK